MTDLPALLAEIAAIAGLDAALAIARAKGGTEVYLPRQPAADHWLVAAVGAETAAKICRELCANQTGTKVLIPLGPTGTLAQARRLAAQLDAAGATAATAALAAGLTERTVRRMRKARRDARREDQRQGRLF